MAHEITSTDNIVLHKQRAWHGMGVVVEDAPTPREALTMANLDWGIDRRDLVSEFVSNGNISYAPIPGYVANHRKDTGEFLGIVSESYRAVENWEVADFCEALSNQKGSPVKIETAGSIRGGKKVWFLLKGEGIEVGTKGDVSHPYILVSNGHDGTNPFRLTPTTIRVVCSNTLHMVIPDGASAGSSALVLKHTGSIMNKITEAQHALAHYGEAKKETVKVMKGLAGVGSNSDAFKQFFLEAYTVCVREVPVIHKTDGADVKEHKNRLQKKSMEHYNAFCERFESEKEIAGATWWNAFNAFSGWLQHERPVRGEDDADRLLKRRRSNLMGTNQENTMKALNIARAHAAV